MLPPQIDVRLIQDASPESLASQIVQSVAPIFALGGGIGIIILSLGWSYAWHWFAEWNIPFSSLGLGADHLFEYGRIVLAHFWWLTLIWICFFFAGAWLLHRAGVGKAAVTALFLVAIVLPWLTSHQMAKIAVSASVKQSRAENYAGWPEAHVIIYEEYSSALPASILSNLSLGPDLCFRMLFRANDGVWLARISDFGSPESSVFIPHEAILYLRLRAPSGGDC